MQEPVNLKQRVLEKLQHLSPEKQQEVLDFVEFLEQKSRQKAPRKSIKGLWADLDVEVSEQDIADARREMWGDFPRKDIG